MRFALLLVLSLVVSACRCGGESIPDAGADAGPLPTVDAGVDAGLLDAGVAYDEYDAWREMRQVLRRSPDAVPARAEALVAAKDLAGLLALVRDDVALLPTSPTGFFDAARVIRWGPEATLRGQSGTPRERAELLRLLAERAGFTATVVVGAPKGTTVTGLLAHGPQRGARIEPTNAELERWASVLPANARLAARVPTPLDADGGVRAEIRAQLAQVSLPSPPPSMPFDATLTEVPLVRVEVDGGVLYANPNADGATLGPSFTIDPPIAAEPFSGERELTVTLFASRSARPQERLPLVTHTWKASEVAGRTVTTAFTTALSATEARRTKVGDATGFIPVLMVRGPGLDETVGQRLSAVGTPVLRDGALVEQSDAGLLIDGERLAPGPTRPEVLTSVTTLEARASAAAFPDVELLVSARRSDNRTVPGLGADAFVIQENGKRLAATLRRTSAGAPRVVLLFDRSTSIPMEFVMGAPAVGHSVAEALFTQFPGAQVQVAAIDINGPTVSGQMVSSLAQVDTQLAALSGTGSEVWTAVDAFSDSGATCLVVISDAVVDDTLTDEMAARVVRGPPVFLAGVGPVDTTTASRIALVTNGRFANGQTPGTLAAAVTAFVSERLPFDYRIIYRAPVMGPTPRTVVVSLAAPGTATTMAQYTPPSSPVEASELSALYLSVATDGHEVTRLLAGSAAATKADREAVAGALFGRYVLGVEAGAPSFTTLLDEHLAERLTTELAVDAWRSGDAMAIAEANKTRLTREPGDLRFFASAAPGASVEDDVTFTDGLTLTLRSTIPVLGVKTIRRFDMLPLVPVETVRFTPGQAFSTTRERTAFHAAFENQRFTRNTLSALRGRPLSLFDSTTIQALGPAWAQTAYPDYNDYALLAPMDGGPVAFWAVHRRTGALIGVMPEGGLGEGESTEALVNRLLTILDAAGRVGVAGGYNGVKVWADLEATKVTLLGGVIMLFDGEGEDPRGDLVNNLCGFAIDSVGGQLPFWEDAGLIPNEVNARGRYIEQMFHLDIPDLPTPSGVICGAILGP
ncbi:MAG: hypothetical protein Q8S33_08460 [Myxococcales bacterium]|nr:hypothetical protein [Myxococcales bacterium]